MSFEQALSQFEATSAGQLASLISSGQEVIAFVGRATCPYCQRFAPKLVTAQAETGAQIYFVDSSRLDDPELQPLRAAHQIVTVPGLLVAKSGQVKVVCDSSLTVDEIKAFMA